MKWTPIAAMIGIVILEAIALLKGVNGTAFSLVIAALAGLGGYEIRVFQTRKKEGK